MKYPKDTKIISLGCLKLCLDVSSTTLANKQTIFRNIFSMIVGASAGEAVNHRLVFGEIWAHIFQLSFLTFKHILSSDFANFNNVNNCFHQQMFISVYLAGLFVSMNTSYCCQHILWGIFRLIPYQLY